MSSASILDPKKAREAGAYLNNPPSPIPMASVTASASRITSRTITSKGLRHPGQQGWQKDAWDMYDLVGEQHFLATTLAGRASQATLYVGQVAPGAIDDPDPVEDESLAAILEAVDHEGHLSQMIDRLVKNLFMVGDCWLAGIPNQLLSSHTPENDPDRTVITTAISDDGDLLETIDDGSMADLTWKCLSLDEVTITNDGRIVLRVEEGVDGKVNTVPEKVFLIRIWRAHPRQWWEADSPTRSVLPVLRELVGLTMHIGAQIDSRLAGAGLLLVPESASAAMKRAEGLPEDSKEDPFGEALLEAMLTPISDRGNASAVVPLIATVPDDTTEKFKLLQFSQELDSEARSMREEAIRRLALGQDAPPELLLGMAGMNHWGAWLVREDVVTTHLEPPLALICDAITTQYLRPMMRAMDYPEQVIRRTVVWYDVSKLIVRPDRASDAGKLFDRGALNAKALREANGFDETDAPEVGEKMDPAAAVVLDMIKTAPSLAADPGLAELYEQVTLMLQGGSPDDADSDQDAEGAASPADTSEDDDEPADGLPDTADDGPNGLTVNDAAEAVARKADLLFTEAMGL